MQSNIHQVVLVFVAMTLSSVNGLLAQDRAENLKQTSENNRGLKRILQQRPEADTNRDGILTLQEAKQSQGQRTRAKQDAAGNRDPTKADVPYGDHERHVLDFWQAKSDKPTPPNGVTHGKIRSEVDRQIGWTMAG